MGRHVTTGTLLAASALTLGFVSASPSSPVRAPMPFRAQRLDGWRAKAVGAPTPNVPVNVRLYQVSPRSSPTHGAGSGDVVKSSLLGVYDAAFMQGSVEGISYAFSTGDNGDEATTLGTPHTDYPASDPLVTGVGGTSTQLTQFGIQAETGWQTSKYVLNATKTAWTVSNAFLWRWRRLLEQLQGADLSVQRRNREPERRSCDA